MKSLSFRNIIRGGRCIHINDSGKLHTKKKISLKGINENN